MSADNTSSSWSVFRLNKQLLNAISDAGFKSPTEIQQKCIPLIAGGQQVIGIAQTGTGKTAAYAVPLVMLMNFSQSHGPRALVIAPTKELVVQLADHIRALAKYTDLKIVAIYGGVGPKAQIEAIRNGVDILVATPGRFMELYLKNEIVVKYMKILVIDEADRMMDMGFMPQLRSIFEVIPQRRQNLLFSATFSDNVDRLSQEFIQHASRIEISPPATTSRKVEQWLYKIPNLKTKIRLLEHLLQDRDRFSRVLVFTRTKESADAIFKFIDRKLLGPARVIHSNKGQNSRINAVNEFKEGKLRILVSTDVSARGLDVTRVSHVVNFDVPVQYEDYVHRIGRTGRAFQEGTAITFVNPAEEYHVKKIEKLIRERIPVKQLPPEVEPEETPFAEAQVMAREIDRQKRLEDPDFKGAFHRRK